jgi:hypothetical protein
VDKKRIDDCVDDLVDVKRQIIISKISKIREKNNECWMDLLRLAFHYAPEKAKIIFRQITENDRMINELSKELCK